MQHIILTRESITIPLLLTLLAGLSTAIGSLIFLFIKRFKDSHLIFCLGFSAGAMLYISFVELLRISINDLGFLTANLFFIAGIAIMMVIDFCVPHRYLQEQEGIDPKRKALYSTGILTAMGLAIHNLPEGFAVFLSGVANLKLGIAFAIAIAAHNIPEGIAVSVPIYYATKNKRKAFTLSFLSGIAEPIGAIIGILLFKPFLTQAVVAYLFALVAGIMVFICFDELLPQAFNKDYHHQATIGLLLGILVMIASLSV
jgi:zinc transporter, ZIP family